MRCNVILPKIKTNYHRNLFHLKLHIFLLMVGEGGGGGGGDLIKTGGLNKYLHLKRAAY